MASPRLIVVYAGYGDTLLLEYDDTDNPGKKGYWLIDGGPLTSRPGTAAWSGTRSGGSSSAGTSKDRKRKNTPTPNKDAVLEFAGSNAYQAYYQFLQQTLIRYCRSKNDSIDLLKGILVTHPHSDHMDGIVQFVADYISNPSPRYKLDFKGPIVVNGDFIPPDAPGKLRYATLWTLLKDNKFKTKKIADRGQVAKDDSIPTQMFNICPGKSIWELWNGSGTSVSPTKDDKPKNGRGASRLALSVDHSDQNVDSILTKWGQGSASPIITTGDSIGQNILEAFKGLKISKDPSFGIFKVPHHGSRRNSQPNEKYQADLSDSEKQEYRFLCILCWGLRGYKPPPLGEEKKWPPEQQFSKEAMAYKEQRQILQKVINDFPKDDKLIQEIGDNIVEFFEAEWIQQRPSENPERSEAGFINALDTLWKALRLYLANGGFKSGKLDLKLDLDLWRLGVLLAGRYSSYSEACYIGDDNQITSCRKVNIVLKIEPIFNFASFIKSKQFVEVMKAQYPLNGEPVPKKAKAPAVPAQVRDLYEALSIDPISIIRFRQGILDFYRKFKATNYVISANGTHHHPSPGTIAGIMAAAIERRQAFKDVVAKALKEVMNKTGDTGKPVESDKCRIFVTTAAALRLNYIISITKYLLLGSLCGYVFTGSDGKKELADYFTKKKIQTLVDRLPSEQLWDDSIELWYLKDDYCAAIPTDLSPVQGCQKVDLKNFSAAQEQVQQLKNDFNKTSAYDIPHAKELRTSTFRLLSSNRVKTANCIEGLPIVLSGSSIGFGAPKDQGLLFCLDNNDSKNGFNLVIIDSGNQPATSTPTVILEQSGRSSKDTGTKFRILDKTNATLHYKSTSRDSNDTEFLSTTNESLVVYVRFERVSGFPATPATDPPTSGTQTTSTSNPQAINPSDTTTTVDDSANVANAPVTEALAAPPPATLEAPASQSAPAQQPEVTTQPFTAWWKQKKSSDSSLTDDLASVLGALLTPFSSYAVLNDIASEKPGFVLSDVADFQVNIDASPAVVGSEPASVTCALIMSKPVIFPDFAGMVPVAVKSIQADILTKPPSLKLHLEMDSADNPILGFTFTAGSSLNLYLHDINCTIDPSKLDLASLAASIVGPDVLWSFFGNLPSMLLVVSKSIFILPIDPQTTEINYSPSPFGPKVESASIAIKLPRSSMQIGPVQCQLVNVVLAINAREDDFFDIALQFVAKVNLNGKDLQFSFSAAQNGPEPVVLDFAAGSATSPSGILQFLGVTNSPSSVSLPLGQDNQNLGVDIKTIGFTLSQPFVGSHAVLDLTSVYFSIGDSSQPAEEGEKALAPWRGILPESVLPSSSTRTLTDWTLKVVLLNPKSSLTVGLLLDFGIHIKDDRSDLRFQASRWPVKGANGIHVTSIGFQVDTNSTLDPPTIDDILQKITGQTSGSVTASIPILGSILQKTSITHGLLAVDGQKVSGFSLDAQIRDWQISSNPSINIATADLLVDYDGTSWSGALSTEIVFADEFICAAQVVLPTTKTFGGLSIRNLSDDFTFGKLVEIIGGGANLKDVPVMGDEDLASLRLDSAQLEVDRSDNGLSVSGFEIALTWGDKNIGRMKTFGNRLAIGMYKGASTDPIGSIIGSGTPDPAKTWFVRWEGGVFDNWHLSASLEYSTIKTTDQKTESVVVLSGVITDSLSSMQPGGLINAWSGSSTTDNDSNSLWQQTVPQNVKSSFQLQECMVSAAIGSTTKTFACGAQASWGEDGQVAGFLVIDQCLVTGSDAKWGFAFALDVRNFRFTDLVSDSKLAAQIDDVFHITQISILVFNNPGNMGLSRIATLINNVSSSSLLSSDSNFLPSTNSLDDSTFDKRISAIQTQDGPNNNKQADTQKAGLAVFARFSFGDSKPGSLTQNLNSLADSKLTDVQLMGYFGKTTQSKTVVVFKASVSSFKPLSSVTMDKIELTYAPSTGSEPGTNQFLLYAECSIEFENIPKWQIEAELIITKLNAKLTTNLAKNPINLLDSNFRLSNIILSVTYTFKSSSDGDKGPTNTVPPPSTDQPSNTPSIDLSLSGHVTLGSLEATASVVFDSQKPGALMIQAPEEWSITELLNKIFGSSLPSDLLDIKFSNFYMYYAWQPMGKSSNTKLRDPFKKGFHAESDIDLFGISLSLSIDINRGDKEDEGLTIAGEKSTSVEVLGLTLHGAGENNKTRGPKLEYSTGPTKKCSITTGIALFGTELGDISIVYEFAKSRFLGTFSLPPKILDGAKVDFELAKNSSGKNVLRIVNLPAQFDDLVKAAQILDKARTVSGGDKCNIFDDLLKDFITTKVHVQMKIPDSQENASPDDQPKTPVTGFNLEVHGSLDILITKKSIGLIDFDSFSITIQIPKSLDELPTKLIETLGGSIEQILQGLTKKENLGKLSEALSVVAVEKLGAKAVSKALCREKNSEDSNEDPEDESKPDQDPVEDVDLPDLVSGGGGGGGGGIFGGLLDIISSIVGGIGGGIAGALFGWLGSDHKPSKDIPKPPPTVPPTPPQRQDAISQVLRKALEPSDKFERWQQCKTFTLALETARDCALDYYSAMYMLGKVLGSGGTYKTMGNKAYTYYCYQYKALQYDLSTLAQRFSDKWLDMSNRPITMTSRLTPDGYKVDISWHPLALDTSLPTIVITAVNGGTPNRQLVQSSSTITIDIPKFSGTQNFNIAVTVSAFDGKQGVKSQDPVLGDDSNYLFFSQGKPASARKQLELVTKVPLSAARRDATTEPQLNPPPHGLNLSLSVPEPKNYPVLVMGNITWWPVVYLPPRRAFVVLAYDATKTLKQIISIDYVQLKPIGDIRINADGNVEIYDDGGAKQVTLGSSIFPAIN